MRFALLSSTRYFDAENEQGSDKTEKTPAQIEREKIKVETSKGTDKATEKEKEEENDSDKNDGEEGDEEGKDGNEEGDESGEDDGEKKELTAEQKEIAKLKKSVERLQKRVGRTTGEKSEIAKQLTDAQASLAAKAEDGKGFTEEEVERRANIKAEEKSSERAFQEAQKKLTKAALKADKDFVAKVNDMAQDVAPIPGAMIGILEDLDNGGEVLAHLANNPDEYEEIYDLPIARMATRLSKLADKLEEDGKPKPKKISKVPAPIEGIKGGSESPTVLPANPTKDKDSMEKFVKMRQQQVEQRRKARLA